MFRVIHRSDLYHVFFVVLPRLNVQILLALPHSSHIDSSRRILFPLDPSTTVIQHELIDFLVIHLWKWFVQFCSGQDSTNLIFACTDFRPHKWFCTHDRAREIMCAKTVTVGANLHCLIHNLLIAIVFPTYFPSVDSN